MQHRPTCMADGAPPYAVALAQRARTRGGVVLYAGAGTSVAQPTGLPNGATLATAVHARLRSVFGVLDEVNATDLVAVADAVAGLPGGEAALRETSAASADFRTAPPAYAHRVIAHLMLEGIVDVLTTNWDDCIERGSVTERLQSVSDERSLSRVAPPWVLKVHGCATEPASLLLTTVDLATPPRWVQEQTRVRLGSSVVIFVGIGDVAGYVRQRIEEAISEVGTVDNIRVVSPGVVEHWEESQWAEVAPALLDDHRIAATADLFMEQLGTSYVLLTLDAHAADLSPDEDVREPFDVARDGLLRADALSVLAWARRCAFRPRQGESVLGSAAMAEALAALGRLVGSDFSIGRNQALETHEGPVEVLVATHVVPARRMEQEAENRLHEHLALDEPAPTFLVAGVIGWSRPTDALPNDILGEGRTTDIVDGPYASRPVIVHAHEVLAS